MTDDLLYRLRGVMCGDDPVIEEAASRIEELEKYQSIHSQCDKSSLEVEGKLVQRLSLAHARIKKLEEALFESMALNINYHAVEEKDGYEFTEAPIVIDMARNALEDKQ